MICEKCKTKILRECIKAMGGLIPLNEIGCDATEMCQWNAFSQEIISILHGPNRKPDFLKDKI